MIACIIIQLSILISCIILVSRYILHYIMIFWLQIHLVYHVYINQCSFNTAHKTQKFWSRICTSYVKGGTLNSHDSWQIYTSFIIKFQSAEFGKWIHAANCVCHSLHMNFIAIICFLHFEIQSYPIYTNTLCTKTATCKTPLLSVVWATIQGEHQPSWSGVDQTRSLWTRRRVRSGSKRVA